MGDQTVDQIAHGALLGVQLVLVRRHTVAGDQIGQMRELARDVAVQIHRRRHEHVWADHVADALQQHGFRIVHAFDGHRAVDVEPQAVQVGRLAYDGLQPLNGFLGQALERLRGDDAAGQGAPDQGRVPVGGFAQRLAGGHERVRVEDFGAAARMECGRTGAGGGEGARLDRQTGDGDIGLARGCLGGGRLRFRGWGFRVCPAGLCLIQSLVLLCCCGRAHGARSSSSTTRSTLRYNAAIRSEPGFTCNSQPIHTRCRDWRCYM